MVPQKRSRQTAVQPWSPEALAEKIWELAGISKQERADALKLAFKGAVRDLDAKKSEVITFEGEVTEVLEVPDNVARAKAREHIFEITRAKGAPMVSQGKIEIPLPPWASGVMVGVKAIDKPHESTSDNQPDELVVNAEATEVIDESKISEPATPGTP
jgi:hypothetical protein